MSEQRPTHARPSPAEQATAPPPRSGTLQAPPEQPPGITGWTGWVIFAGLTMLILGGFQAVMGLVSLFNTDFYVITPDNLAIPVNYTTWGWTHLILGLIVALAGVAILAGKTWGRVVGIILAALQAIATFAWLPAYPFWATIVIVVDLLVIYALAIHGNEMRLFDRER